MTAGGTDIVGMLRGLAPNDFLIPIARARVRSLTPAWCSWCRCPRRPRRWYALQRQALTDGIAARSRLRRWLANSMAQQRATLLDWPPKMSSYHFTSCRFWGFKKLRHSKSNGVPFISQ